MGRASGAKQGLAAAAGRRGRRREWHEERIKAELQALVGPMDYFPTHTELCALGHSQLAYAVNRYGGTEEWAKRLGKALRPRQADMLLSARYTEEMALSDARSVIAALGELPGSTKLRQMG
jgi:hypothetical protein